MIASPPAHIRAANVPDTQRIIRVLEAIENGNPRHAGGRLCWTLRAWRETTPAPFSGSMDPTLSRAVANVRLVRMCERFRMLGITPTAELLIGSWLHGFDGVVRMHRAHVRSGYMERGANLYADATFP